MSIHNFFIKLTDLNVKDSACIKSIEGSTDLVIHLMELGLVKNTLLKVVNITNYLITISFRNIKLIITKDIGDEIIVNRINR